MVGNPPNCDVHARSQQCPLYVDSSRQLRARKRSLAEGVGCAMNGVRLIAPHPRNNRSGFIPSPAAGSRRRSSGRRAAKA